MTYNVIVLTCCMLQKMPMVIAEVASPRAVCDREQLLVRITGAENLCRAIFELF